MKFVDKLLAALFWMLMISGVAIQQINMRKNYEQRFSIFEKCNFT